MMTLENDFLKVMISSGRSMRIESFFDKKRNKEWVWRPESRDELSAHENLDLDASFDPQWVGGWEEIFPNDAPCRVNGVHLVDHGEVWRRSWEYRKESENSVTGHFTCQTLPLQLSKNIALSNDEASLKIDYEIFNMSDEDQPYLFKFHPALKIEEGDRFIFPSAKMKPVALSFSRLLSSPDKVNFPSGKGLGGDFVSIDRVKPNDGYSREFVYLSSLKEGRCSLYGSATNTELLFEFPLQEIPYVGLFQSYGGFMDHYVAMLEPTTSNHYDLEELIQNQRAEVIGANQRKSFSIKISLKDL